MTGSIEEILANHPLARRIFRNTLVRSVAYPVLLMLLVIVLFLWQLSSVLATTQRVEHSNNVITQSSIVLNLLVDMETGLRGYLLTDDALFLEPYQQAEATFDANFQVLQNLVSDNQSQQENLTILRTDIMDWQQFATDMLTARDSGDGANDSAAQLVGKQQMDSIRTQLADFVDTEEFLRSERIRVTQQTSQFVIISVIIGGLIVGASLALSTRQQLIRLSQAYTQTLLFAQHQTQEVSVQQEWLRGVLSSMGDAVIAADIVGNVAFMNRITEQLTGWPAKEAVGKPLGLVYKTIEEDATLPMGQERALQITPSKYLISRDGKDIAINDSIASIKDTQGKPVGTVVVFRDVTRRNQIEQERIALIESQAHYAKLLRHSNEQLQRFAYAASHDLQEPLRMVVSYLQLLEQRYADSVNEETREFIGYAVDGAMRMKELITGLLAFARLDSPEQEMNQQTPLEEVLERVLTNLSVSIAESSAVITHDPLPEIQADPVQMTQLFQNLLANAIKFHSEQPLRIHIGAERKGAEWQFSVRDSGIGIAPEYQERIFVLFQRLHHRNEYPGTGIGLTIAKKVVERHRGRIWVESTAGNGATFYFTLPIKRSALPPLPQT